MAETHLRPGHHILAVLDVDPCYEGSATWWHMVRFRVLYTDAVAPYEAGDVVHWAVRVGADGKADTPGDAQQLDAFTDAWGGGYGAEDHSEVHVQVVTMRSARGLPFTVAKWLLASVRIVPESVA